MGIFILFFFGRVVAAASLITLVKLSYHSWVISCLDVAGGSSAECVGSGLLRFLSMIFSYSFWNSFFFSMVISSDTSAVSLRPNTWALMSEAVAFHRMTHPSQPLSHACWILTDKEDDGDVFGESWDGGGGDEGVWNYIFGLFFGVLSDPPSLSSVSVSSVSGLVVG